jgi:hypothetical protein
VLIYWSLRREDLCDPDLQPKCERGAHAPDCPLTQLEEALANSRELGALMARAFDLMLERELAGYLDLDSRDADEVQAMKLVKIEQARYERELAKRTDGR